MKVGWKAAHRGIDFEQTVSRATQNSKTVLQQEGHRTVSLNARGGEAKADGWVSTILTVICREKTDASKM